MILARIKLLGISSADDKCLKVEVHDVDVLDTRDLRVKLPAGFHERLMAKLAHVVRSRPT
jgi:hypothetical protein